MIAEATTRLGKMGVLPVNTQCAPAMRAFVLPQRRAAQDGDTSQLMRDLWHKARIQIAAMVLGEKLLLRISVQAYVGVDDIAFLGDALTQHGWPGY